MNTFHICLMQHNDLHKAAEVLSMAMLDNPLHQSVFLGNGDKERREIESMFSGLFMDSPGIVFLAKEQDVIVGVMRMKSCVGKVVAEPDRDADIQDIDRRKSIWFREWAARDPVEQHWHLGPIGVLPSHRGRGIGTALMDRFCREVDRCQAKAYLETDLDENVRFYETFGFRVISSSDIFHVENRYMMRDPKAERFVFDRSAS